MKAIGINGSPRKDGNTAIVIDMVFKELKQKDIGTEMIQLAGPPIRGCTACMQCAVRKNGKCVFDDDIVNECIAAMAGADGIVLGSPVYFATVTAGLKGLIERAGMVAAANGEMFTHKVGAGVVAVRRAGATGAFDAMNRFFLSRQMVVIGSNYWNLAIGRDIGDVENDEEGVQTLSILGKNMAWLLGRLKG